MVAKIKSFVLEGLNATPVVVEVDIHQGLPAVHIIGLADRSMLEARLRVSAAIKNSGLVMPLEKIVINLTPAAQPKYGTCLDLAIALGILCASKQIPHKQIARILQESAFWGELSLLGTVNGCRGALSVAISAREQGLSRLFLAANNAKEAGIIAGIEYKQLNTLAELVTNCSGGTKDLKPGLESKLELPLSSVRKEADRRISATTPCVDFSEIVGQSQAKRALEIAAAGGHNVLLSGPPGVGKTLLCQALRGILPPLSLDEALMVSRIKSISGLIPETGDFVLEKQRPFRAPHHCATTAAIIGGGSRVKPGEITLAHHGVLFFDECNQFDPQILEALREPLEQNQITIARQNGVVTYPANFIFIAAINPCPCGNYSSNIAKCTCTASQIAQFKKKMSAPILDRIDMQLQVEKETQSLLRAVAPSEGSESICKRVVAARQIQKKRGLMNKLLSLKELRKWAPLSGSAQDLFQTAVKRLELSNRELVKVWRVARTIADLSNESEVNDRALAEALSYRLVH